MRAYKFDEEKYDSICRALIVREIDNLKGEIYRIEMNERQKCMECHAAHKKQSESEEGK